MRGFTRNSSYYNRSDCVIILVAIVGFIIELLAPVFAGIIILIIIVAGGAWLYAKYRSR
jgi:hypothetical protein